MSDHTASNPAPVPQNPPSLESDPWVSATVGTHQHKDWQVITFPGQMALEDHPATAPAPVAPDPTPSAPLHRTEDLIQLIQDLNQCNDALLLRVSDLEESLEQSQAALQSEVERHPVQGSGVAERGPTPPQIAQLLSELEVANDGLRRASLHNETLQTELEASQQRVAQLERECTLLQQRFSEKNTALQAAEHTCRDLKARLHRQQRYTLQFKTALEKCLNVANDPPRSPAGRAAGQGAADTQPMAMPKAQEIQPWTAPGAATPPSPDLLSNLIHSLRGPTVEGADPSPVDPEDIVTHRTWSEPAAHRHGALANPATPSAVEPWIPSAAPDPAPTLGFTEPFPWGAPVADRITAAQVDPTPHGSEAAPARGEIPAPATPAQTPTTPAGISPPHPQRKLASLAAVQLPSFGRPPHRP